jgi:hypothetical protein
MRAVLGLVSLLVVLAIVGLIASKQLKGAPGKLSPASIAASATVGLPTGTVREQSQQLQDKVRSDVNKALQQGAQREESAQ